MSISFSPSFLELICPYKYQSLLCPIYETSSLIKICKLQAKANAPKPNRRKKWRKSTILLVSNPPPSSQPESADATQKLDDIKNNNNNTSDVEIPLKLPRAMRSVASNIDNPLRERNAGKSDVFANEESAVLASNPQKRTSEEKENNGL